MDVRKHLRSKGITQRDIATHLSVSCGTVSKWLSKKVPIPSRMALAMSRYIGLDVGKLLEALEPEL